jgi:hypothetical protein
LGSAAGLVNMIIFLLMINFIAALIVSDYRKRLSILLNPRAGSAVPEGGHPSGLERNDIQTDLQQFSGYVSDLLIRKLDQCTLRRYWLRSSV